MSYLKFFRKISWCSGFFIFLFWMILLTGCGSGSDNSGTPNANAGDDQEVLTAETASLDGEASTGVETATWTFSSRPTGSAAALVNEDNLTPTFTPDVNG